MTESTDKPLLDKALADEQQLDQYLKGDSSVSRQYRQLHSAEVPTELDRLVLRQAEDAVESRPVQSRPAWVRWTAPLAVAASAVLVLSIVIETGVRDETVSGLSVPQSPMQAKQREDAESKTEATSVPEAAAPVSGLAAPAEVPAEPASDERLADYSQPRQVAAPPPPKLEMPAPESLRRRESANEAPQPSAETVTEKRSPPPPVAAPAAPAIMPARSVSRAAQDAARVLNASSLEEATQVQGAAAADEAQREEDRSAAQMAYSRQITTATPAPPHADIDPEKWLENIRQLRKENKQEQADLEWRRFRAAFPDYEVAETDAAREVKK